VLLAFESNYSCWLSSRARVGEAFFKTVPQSLKSCILLFVFLFCSGRLCWFLTEVPSPTVKITKVTARRTLWQYFTIVCLTSLRQFVLPCDASLRQAAYQPCCTFLTATYLPHLLAAFNKCLSAGSHSLLALCVVSLVYVRLIDSIPYPSADQINLIDYYLSLLFLPCIENRNAIPFQFVRYKYTICKMQMISQRIKI
jgi:hypothetical protein